MLFNSFEFIFAFLPITFLIYFYLNNMGLPEAGKGFLVFASLFFYGWWNPIYLPIILASLMFNYIVGNVLTKDGFGAPISRKSVLTMAVTSNLALLGYFKYSDFFIENFNFAFGADVPLLHLALPLAISFFTFQQITYLVDSYRGETREYDFLNYAVFVTFFPQLIAGPIVHHKEMMPQFASYKAKLISYRNIALGTFIFSMGLFKKVAIADTFAVWANAGFDDSQHLNLIEAWVTSLSYTFQLYFDFSAYTDMAIGLALLFNIKLPINFNSPYKATNIQDFWRRWHMTLSRFLKDYVYIPLGGNRKGGSRTYLNLLATFILGGLWHGAGWTFIFWGALHGIAMVVFRAWSRFGIRLWTWLAWFITFNFVSISWVFFRAKEWEDAIKVLSGMFALEHYEWLGIYDYGAENFEVGMPVFSALIVGFVLVLFCKNTNERLELFKPTSQNALMMVALFIVSVSMLSRESEFLYFNF